MIGECRALLNNVILQANNGDHWQWKLDLAGCYSISGTYQLLVQVLSHVHTFVTDLILHKDIPLNVYVFYTCLLINRLPIDGQIPKVY